MVTQDSVWACLSLAEMLLVPEERFTLAKYPIPGKSCLQLRDVMHKCLYCSATGKVDFILTFLFSAMSSWKMLGSHVGSSLFLFGRFNVVLIG